ncbi:hypothetical protein MMC30_005530 [Trapelia coarctata]|nr:hypothetical protein [Trapelia coarctata]
MAAQTMTSKAFTLPSFSENEPIYLTSPLSKNSDTKSAVADRPTETRHALADVTVAVINQVRNAGDIGEKGPSTSLELESGNEPVQTDETPLPGSKTKVPSAPEEITEISEAIVGVLERYRLSHQVEIGKAWAAKEMFLARINKFVAQNEPILMALPAFPFKSPSKKIKVLGDLPDKGEEVALSHLQGFCLAIRDVYPPGAKVYIVSDGLMYNDLLGVSDQEVWRYGQALRQLARDCNCDHVSFVRLRDLIQGENLGEPLSEEAYLRDAPRFRAELNRQYLPEGFDPDVQISKDADTMLTYRGYIKFLEIDLATAGQESKSVSKSQLKKNHEKVAKQMIVRGKAFANAIAISLSSHIRLSIHPSTEVSKLSMALTPQIGRSSTPWHSCLVRALDGSITMSHANQVPALTHELVFKNGQPSYFRERSALFDWPGMDVEFDYMYPCGIMITPRDRSAKYSLHNVHMRKVRQLSEQCSPVVLRGFTDTTDVHTFEAKAYDAGVVAPWTFGVRQAVKDVGNNDHKASTVTSSEAMPMHYDGFFFFAKETGPDGIERKVSKVPGFQYFTSITPSPPGSGYTLFASSQHFFQHLPASHSAEELAGLTWNCRHSSNWAHVMTKLPLVIKHPVTGKPCIRWHEPWEQSRTKFSYNEINIENGHQRYKELVTDLLYDRRVCLYFAFQKGDVLVTDNISMMHTRTAFQGESGRELWRIHFN